MRRFWRASGACVLAASVGWGLLAASVAHASVAVLVEEPYGSLGRVNPAGHVAIYLDHVCAASPTRLRACREGEMGAVVSRYNGIGNYDWLAMPLVAYLYAVDAAGDVPATMDPAAEKQIRDTYRRAHLTAIAPDREDGSAPDGNWEELVGSAYDRTLYGFQVKTTSEQDAALIAVFNDRKNVSRYNGAFINCADFVRVTINRFYPHAVRRSMFADLGITTPKHVAKALTKYAQQHPETELETFVIPQVAGSVPRSHRVKGVTECLLTCKRYSLPIVAVAPAATAAMFVGYMYGGRFDMPKDAPVLSMRGGSGVAEVPVTEADLPMPATMVKTSFSAAGAALLGTNQ